MEAVGILARTVESNEFNADLYGALSTAARLASSIRNKAFVLKLVWDVNRINKSLKMLFDRVEASANGEVVASQGSEQEFTPQMALDTADNVRRLSRMIGYCCEMMRRAGLANNSLASSSLRKFASYQDPLEDLADWVEVVAQKSAVEGIFRRAASETERGETVDIGSV